MHAERFTFSIAAIAISVLLAVLLPAAFS